MFEILGASLVLAALLSINAIATVFASGLWLVLSRYAEGWSIETRARVLIALRVYPASGSVVLAIAVIVPAYLFFEPRHTSESVGGALAVVASLSTLGILLALWRGIAAWLVTARLERSWLNNARNISLVEIRIPALVFNHPFPVVAVLGAFRPRLFIAAHVLEALTPSELSAAILHELAHMRSHDNLKRIALRACRDVLTIIPSGRKLDRAWVEVSEQSADTRAANRNSLVALDLASALVKVSRLVPQNNGSRFPAGAYLVGDSEGPIESRVQRLLTCSEVEQDLNPLSDKIASLGLWFVALIFLAATAAAAANSNALFRIHALIEWVVAALS